MYCLATTSYASLYFAFEPSRGGGNDDRGGRDGAETSFAELGGDGMDFAATALTYNHILLLINWLAD